MLALALPPRWALPFRRYVSTKSWLHGKFGEDHPNAFFLRVLDREIAAAGPAQDTKVDAKTAHKLELHQAMLKRLATRVLDTDVPVQTEDDLRRVYAMSFASLSAVTPMLREARTMQMSPSASAKKDIAKNLMTIDRVGSARARTLIKEGITTVEAAKEALAGMMRYPKSKFAFEPVEQLETVTKHAANLVLDIIKSLHKGSDFEFHLTGRHRRNLDDSRDIMIIATHKGPFETLLRASGERQLTRTNAKRTFEARLHAAALIEPLLLHGYVRKYSSKGCYSRVVLFRIPRDKDERRKERIEALEEGKGTYVMVDLRIVPREALGATLLYNTGDRVFVKSIREDAVENGLRLEEYGLWRRCSEDEVSPEELPPSQSSIKEDGAYWRFVPTPSERAAFDAIGSTFVEPHRRNFGQIVTSRRKANSSIR